MSDNLPTCAHIDHQRRHYICKDDHTTLIAITLVKISIAVKPEQRQAGEHLGAESTGVFTNSAGKDQRVQTFKRRGQSANLTCPPQAENVDGPPLMGVTMIG